MTAPEDDEDVIASEGWALFTRRDRDESAMVRRLRATGAGWAQRWLALAPRRRRLILVVTVAVLVIAAGTAIRYGTSLREIVAELIPATAEALSFSLVGFLLGRMYVQLGAMVMLLIIAPILVAREMFSSYMRVKESHDETVQLLIRALEQKDPYTAGHAERVAVYAGYIGEELDFMPVRMERLRFAALMHDIGKLVVPNHLLNKPGKLTEEEFARVRIHEGV